MRAGLLNEVISAIDKAATTLLFTHTRSQAELWYRSLVEKRLDWLTTVSLHHGSKLALDVLIQHRVTLAAGPGFDENELLAEVRSTYSYADLNDREWNWALDFVTRGYRRR